MAMMHIALLLFSLFYVANAAPQVKIGTTNIIGREFFPAKVDFFGGIPYALPPVGEQSLKPPVVSKSLGLDEFNAKNFGFACLQAGMPPETVSSDCLTINIFRPAGTSPVAKLPVMLWIHGGGFFEGASSQAPFNGTNIVKYSVERGTPVIFASLNYRLGPLGFPQGIEAGQRKILNLGLQDQLAGLQWLHTNVGNFGGDPKKILVFGQSAGATSINLLLFQDVLGSLARALIIESDVLGSFYLPERNENDWQKFVASVPECADFVNTTNTFQCIREASSTSLLTAVSMASNGFQPVIDGTGGIIPDLPSRLTPKTQLPTMIGTNKDEATLFAPQNIDSVQTILNFLTGFSPSLLTSSQQNATIQRILELYPDVPALGSPFGTGNDTFGLNSEYKRYNAIWGDSLIQGPRRSFAQRGVSGKPLFVYHFVDEDAPPIPGIAMSSVAPGSIGVTHTAEIPYVFGQLENVTPNAIFLSAQMRDYWISFATSLDPNDGYGHKRVLWPQYSSRNELLQLNGRTSQVLSDAFREDQIAFIQANSEFFHR